MNWSVAGAKDSKNQSLSESLGILDLKICFLKKIKQEKQQIFQICTTFLWNPFRHNLNQLSVEKRIRVTLENVLKLFGSAEGHPNRCTHAVDNEGTQTFQGC